MSTSDARQRRSRLIAEMSRNIKLNDLSITSSIASKRNDRSFASSTGSKHGTISSSSTGSRHGTISRDSTRSTDFDPERDEALVSTQRMEFDVSQKLPQIRDTARKYGRWAPRKPDDFKINTSAIGRAFPDFTQGDTEMSLSIEQPRVHSPKRSAGPVEGDSSLASITNNMRLRGSPRKPRPQSPILEALGRKENKGGAAPQATLETVGRKEDKENIAPKNLYRDPYDSVDNDTFSTLPKPSPLKYQAQVDDITESSLGEGPSTTKPNTSQPLSAKVTSNIPSVSKVTAHATRTGQSFIIPSVPAEEVASATVTKPVIQMGKVVTRRSRQRPVNNFEGEHQEENIYQMIDLLREKVADLEKINQSTQQTIIGLQRDKDQLATEKREIEARNDQLAKEKKELEARNKEAQTAIKKLEAKAADYDLVHEINSQAQRIISKLQEKVADHEAINTEAQKMIMELQEENEQLAQENEKLSTTNSEAHDTITGLQKDISRQDEVFSKKVTTLEQDIEKLARESRRMGRRIPSNDPDATMRPAQDPREALKEVIESAEAEMRHMKSKLADLQKAYLAHDPAMGRRARKVLKEQIDNAVKEIEIKSDKIYQLYDIKEGLAYY